MTTLPGPVSPAAGVRPSVPNPQGSSVTPTRPGGAVIFAQQAHRRLLPSGCAPAPRPVCLPQTGDNAISRRSGPKRRRTLSPRQSRVTPTRPNGAAALRPTHTSCPSGNNGRVGGNTATRRRCALPPRGSYARPKRFNRPALGAASTRAAPWVCRRRTPRRSEHTGKQCNAAAPERCRCFRSTGCASVFCPVRMPATNGRQRHFPAQRLQAAPHFMAP